MLVILCFATFFSLTHIGAFADDSPTNNTPYSNMAQKPVEQQFETFGNVDQLTLKNLKPTSPVQKSTMLSNTLSSINAVTDLNDSDLNYYLQPDGDRIPSDNIEIINLANSIIAGKTSEEDKALSIYHWVMDNIQYDYSFTYYEALETLHQKTGVCNGYALLTASLMRAVGIPCKFAIGDANGAYGWQDHAWDEIYLGGCWFSIDATWDSQYWHWYQDDNPDAQLNSYGMTYYKVDEKSFSSDHRKIFTNLKNDYTYKGESLLVTLGYYDHKTILYYTLDGSEPTIHSQLYTNPIQITPGNILTVRSVSVQGVNSYLQIPFIQNKSGFQYLGIENNQEMYFENEQKIALSGHIYCEKQCFTHIRIDGIGNWGASLPLGGNAIDLSQTRFYFENPVNPGRYKATILIESEDETQETTLTVYFNIGITPTIKTTYPVNYSATSEIDRNIIIQFNTNITKTAKFDGILLKDENGNPVAINRNTMNNQIILDPIDNLKYATLYTVYIPNGAVKDSLNNELPYEKTMVFSTKAQPDNAPPVFIGSDPVNNATGIPIDQKIILRFNENIGSFALGLSVSSESSPETEIHSINNEICVSLVDRNKWGYGSTIDIQLVSVEDWYGNICTEPLSFKFTTLPKPLTLLSCNPANNATGVLTSIVPSITFDQTIVAGSAYNNITFMNGSKSVSFSKKTSGGVLTLTPTSALAKDSDYTITIPANAIKTSGGGTISKDFILSFRTVDSVILDVSTATITGSPTSGFTANVPVSVSNSSSLTLKGNLFIVLYDAQTNKVKQIKNRSLTLNKNTNTNITETFAIGSSQYKIKAFWWDSLNNLPLCKATEKAL